MILKYFDNKNKEIIEHHVIKIRKGFGNLEYQFKNEQIIEVDSIDRFYVEEENTSPINSSATSEVDSKA